VARIVNTRSREAYLLEGGAVVIGRLADRSITLPGRSVSRKHCFLQAAEGCWIIEDAGSKMGTYVNGERLAAPRPVKSGDQIAIGNTVLVFDEGAAAGEGLRLRRVEAAAPDAVRSLGAYRRRRRLLTWTPVLIGVAMAAVALGIRLLTPVLTRESAPQAVRRAARLACERRGPDLWAMLTDNRRHVLPAEALQRHLDALPDSALRALRTLETGQHKATDRGVVVPVSIQLGDQRLDGQVVIFSDGRRWRIHSAPTEWLAKLPR